MMRFLYWWTFLLIVPSALWTLYAFFVTAGAAQFSYGMSFLMFAPSIIFLTQLWKRGIYFGLDKKRRIK